MQGLCMNSKVYYCVSLLISQLNVTSLGTMQDHVFTYFQEKCLVKLPECGFGTLDNWNNSQIIVWFSKYT